MKKFKQKLGLILILSASLMASACNTRTGVESNGNSEEANLINSSDIKETENTHKLTVPNKISKKTNSDSESTSLTISKDSNTSLTVRKGSQNTPGKSKEDDNGKNSSDNSINSDSAHSNKNSTNRSKSTNGSEGSQNSQNSEEKFDFSKIKLGNKTLTLPFSTKDLVDLGYESTKTGELEQYSYALDVPFIQSEARDDVVTVDIINLEEKPRPVESAPVYSITINNYGVFSKLELSNGINFDSSREDIIKAHSNKYSGVAQIKGGNNETIIKFNSTKNEEISIEYTLIDSKLIRIKLTTDKFLAPQ